tara:strand:- start:35 stop:202 length:168 start_codon:yes stop_codon:yes gene_type:complete
MTKLEELKASFKVADAARVAAWVAYDAARVAAWAAYEAADTYEAELKKTKEQAND